MMQRVRFIVQLLLFFFLSLSLSLAGFDVGVTHHLAPVIGRLACRSFFLREKHSRSLPSRAPPRG